MYEYHATCGGSKKVVKTDRKVGLPLAVQEAFGLDPNAEVAIQIRDDTWDDVVDVEHDCLENLPDRARLMAVVTTNMAIPVMEVVTSASSDITAPTR